MFKTDKYKIRGQPDVKGTKTGGERRYSLTFSKARCQSSFQTIGWFFLRRRKIGSHMFVNIAMKRLIYYSLRRKPLTTISVLGAVMSSMALIFLGSTFIPRSLTMCPNNFPKVTPKVNFLGFNLSLNRLILLNNLCKAAK